MGHELVSRPSKALAASLLGLGLTAAPVAATLAADVSVGAGLRTSFVVSDPDGAPSSSGFGLNSARIYISGKVTDQIGFMFNTEYTGFDTDGTAATIEASRIDVMDAAATFTFSDSFNIMAGRFLAPSDRANLYGPYYGNNWGFAVDGVQDGYPFSAVGRDEGVMYWGQFGITKIALGAFHNFGAGNGDLKYAGRVQVDLWDPEGGYYQNGSYYGAKDLLAFGLASQGSSGNSTISFDVLMEKKLSGGGVVTLEGEYVTYDNYGYYPWFADGTGYYGLAAYMFPTVIGIGKFQVLGKFGTADVTGGGKVDTMEFNLNYIIKDQAARLHLFYIDSDMSGAMYGLGLQIQM